MRIAITGSVGSGKSVVAEALGKLLNIPNVIQLSQFVREKKLARGYDRKRKAYIVDPKKVKVALEKHLKGKKDFIVEGHLLAEFPVKVDYVFVLRAHPKVLIKRLKKRKYPKEKIDENVMAELLDYFSIKAEKLYKKAKIFEINTSERTPTQTAMFIRDIIKGRRKKGEKVDWSKELLNKVVRRGEE